MFHAFLWPIMLLIGALFVITAVIGIFAILFRVREDPAKVKAMYDYSARKYFLTQSERKFYNSLGQAVGDQYRIFAQVHLPSIVEHKIKNGQNWKGAFAHINGKSVDFVLCDKDNVSPVLAIELDDYTHELPDRVERDIEVERILEVAGVPLLRIPNGRDLSPESVGDLIDEALGQE